MKIFKFVLPAAVLALVAAFLYIALTDVPVQQKDVVKTISTERFFDHAAP